MSTPSVAISDDFLTAFAKLPRAQQKKVREFTEKFRSDPRSPSIHYEPIHDMRDEKVRTARIDDAYRAIIVHPPAGNVFLLVWVDHHDEAMAWARRKRFDVNPATGSLQVYEVRSESAPAAPAAPPPQPPRRPDSVAPGDDVIPAGRLFAGITHADLFVLGVPEPLLPSVRAVRTEVDLMELLPFLPAEVSEALFLLAAGEAIDAVFSELERKRASKPVDVTDFRAALEHPDSKARFKVLESEQDLLDVLSKPLELWRIFLHPSQRKVVEWDVRGPVRLLGGAGTGKTVVAMHRARYLAKRHARRPDARILLTTFTRNLARDIERSLSELCGPERASIEVTNLHQWANNFLRGKGVKFTVAAEPETRDLWRTVTAEGDLAPAFYREEWRYVVQAQDIVDRDGYLAARRTGRGTSLSRAKKAEVWEVFEAYRAGLDARGLYEQEDVIREARLYLERNPGTLPYVAVVADEVQDFRVADLRLLRAMVPAGENDLFLTGDAHQRIYGHRASLKSCGIDIRGRARQLRVNYRTTEQIRNFAVALLEGVKVDDLDDGLDSVRGYRSLRQGTAPEVRHFSSQAAEGEFIVSRLKAWMEQRPAREICLAARTNDRLASVYEPILAQAGIPHVTVKTDPDADLADGVRLCTMHRMKGLEFPCVLLAAFNEDMVPLRLVDETFADAASREDHEQSERCLAHVAASRARDELVITSFGRASPWVR